MKPDFSGSRRIILTTGDPNGIGPEIILKIFSEHRNDSDCLLYVSGSKKIFDFYSNFLNLPQLPAERIIDIPLGKKIIISPGRIEKQAGKFAGESIRTAAMLCVEKKFDGMVTLPVSKESLNLGGFNYPGHTEMLASLTHSANVVMIMHSADINVALVTGHVAVSKISGLISKKNIIRKVIAVNNSLVKDFGIRNPKLALLSLNPHAGDGGLLGNEENKIITPVIEEMNSAGFNLRGPFASDGYFANGSYKRFHATIAMYHDQGLIPFKMISFGKGVNFSAGLKILRSSPDHGTAFDIAGTGKANPESTLRAIDFINHLIKNKQRK